MIWSALDWILRCAQPQANGDNNTNWGCRSILFLAGRSVTFRLPSVRERGQDTGKRGKARLNLEIIMTFWAIGFVSFDIVHDLASALLIQQLKQSLRTPRDSGYKSLLMSKWRDITRWHWRLKYFLFTEADYRMRGDRLRVIFFF